MSHIPAAARPVVSARATAASAPPRAPSAAASSGPSPSLAALNAALAGHIARAAETAPARERLALSRALGAYMGRVARGELPLRRPKAPSASPSSPLNK